MAVRGLNTDMDANDFPLACATRVGSDFCWPATQVLGALDAFTLASVVLLGVELWKMRDDGTPEVLGWTDYNVDLGVPWPEAVRASHRLAVDAVLGFDGDLDLWVNVTWLPPTESTSFKASAK